MTDTDRVSKWFTPSRFGVLLALLVFASFPQVVLGIQTFVIRDFGFFAYPLASFQRECFWHGEIPFWNPYNECGVPFLAQWNTMALYPPALFYLVFPLQWSLGVFCLLHLWFAGMGMYRLARRWTNNDSAAAFAGTAFAFNGLTLNLLMWPSHIATLSWMPWVMLAVEAAWRDGGRKIFLAAIAGALQMLVGGPETIFLTWMIVSIFWLRHFVKGETNRTVTFWAFPVVIILVIALASIQLIPFFELASHSQRGTGYADLRSSMPAWGWVNLLVPMAFGGTWNSGVFFQYNQWWTSSYYPGIASLWLAVIAVCKVRQATVRLLAILAVAALVFALGEHTFLYPAIRHIIPALGLVTYPIKFMILLAFAAPLLAAFGLAECAKRDLLRPVITLGLVLLAMIAAILFWANRFPITTDDVHATTINGLVRILFLVITGALLASIIRKKIFPWIATALLVSAAWLDVLTHEPPQNPTASPSIYSPDLAREKLQFNPPPAPGASRVMPTPAAFQRFANTAIHDPQKNFLIGRLGCQADCNLLDHIPKVDGFFSLAPREWSNVRGLLYNHIDVVAPGLEAFIGVSQVTTTNDIYEWQSRSNFLPIITAGQQPVFLDDSNVLKALVEPGFDGRRIVYLPPDARNDITITDQLLLRRREPPAVNIADIRFENSRIKFKAEADESIMVVIAQSYFFPWHAYIDGRQASLLRANDAFQAVQVPAGAHHVTLVYQDRGFMIGAAVSIGTLITCLVASILLGQKKRAQP